MIRSQSAPGLGKGCNPLHEYRSDSKSLLSLCAEEQEAERLYYAAVSASLPKRACMVLAKDLDRRTTDAGAYLAWLIYRGHQWPGVASRTGTDACLP